MPRPSPDPPPPRARGGDANEGDASNTEGSPLRALRRWIPGTALVAALTTLAYAVAHLPGAGLLGPLVIAMLLGIAWRAARPESRSAVAPGARFAAKSLLRLGIVLLGARLDARALVELGPLVLVGSAVGALAAFAAVEAVGRAWRVPVDLRRAVGVGTAICGASAIAAALPVLRARDQHASTSIAAISLLGTLGVVAFALGGAAAPLRDAPLGLLAGATLQEVGQVVAAGAAMGEAEADLALLVKLSRVVLLAPALLALGWWGARSGPPAGAAGGTSAARPARTRATPAMPLFVVGFLAMGVATSLGLLPGAAAGAAAWAGTLLTAAAMTGIGLGVDARALGGAGQQALGLALVGFVTLLATMAAYYLLLV